MADQVDVAEVQSEAVETEPDQVVTPEAVTDTEEVTDDSTPTKSEAEKVEPAKPPELPPEPAEQPEDMVPASKYITALIKAHGVPEELVSLLPKTATDLEAYLESDSYQALSAKLAKVELVPPKEKAPETAPRTKELSPAEKLKGSYSRIGALFS